MKYPIAEKFFAPQGEGLFTGTPMAFIRFVGCSVGKKICHACDTDFERMHPELGGGVFEIEELVEWVGKYKHVCFTGGEPMDRNLVPLIAKFWEKDKEIHIETSGTKYPDWIENLNAREPFRLWLTVSPKPGYIDRMLELAGEVKVILHGLGSEKDAWPTLEDALRWANENKLVYLQPANEKHSVDKDNLRKVITLVEAYPQLRLSVQLHKFLETR